ncbi:MAG: hypothetical protein D6729_01825 [Deltaproteobacteria bacterium]|nr:MAG: hypothetical protein D6729_01825 [Deltaproteobacteria bacterium]
MGSSLKSVQAQLEGAARFLLSALNLPTRDDFARLERSLDELERVVEEMEAKLEQTEAAAGGGS